MSNETMNDLETTAAFDQGKMLTTGWLLLEIGRAHV